MTAGKTIALNRWTFVSKVLSLLFNMLSRLITAFLPRRKCLLISWLQSPSAVILEPPKIKSVTVSIISPSICHEVMGLDAVILVFWMLSFKPGFSLLFHFPPVIGNGPADSKAPGSLCVRPQGLSLVLWLHQPHLPAGCPADPWA